MPTIPSWWVNIKTFEDLAYLKEDLAECKRVAFDTETTGLTVADKVFGISLAVGETASQPDLLKPVRAYWFNFNLNENEALTASFLSTISDLFTDGRHKLLMHNAAFDLKMMDATFGIRPGLDTVVDDTMLLALLVQRFPKVGLKELTAALLKRAPEWAGAVEMFFKSMNLTDKDNKPYYLLPESTVFPYACEDTVNTFELFYVLTPYFSREIPELQDIYRLEREVLKVCADLECGGMVIDADYFTSLKDRLNAEIDDDITYFQKLWWPDALADKVKKNLNSSVELSKPLFGKPEQYQNALGLDERFVYRTPKTGAMSLKSVYLLKSFPECEAIKRIVMYKARITALEHFIEPILERQLIHNLGTEDEYRTIHTNYWQIKETGRFGSSNINLQNITNDKLATEEKKEYSIRRGFIAPKGYLLVSADFKSFEVAILANASQDPKLVEDQLNGMDFHSMIGQIAYHRPYADLIGKVDQLAILQRTQIKKTSFLFIYGGGVRKAIEVNGLHEQEAYEIKASIAAAYPYMDTWRSLVVDKAAKSGKIHTLCGRMRRIDPNKAYTTAVNTICQGTAADIMKYGHVEVAKILVGKLSRQAATIHDEIHFYFHPSEAELVPLIVAALEKQRFNPPQHGAKTYVPMKVELSMGPNWGAMHDCTVEQIQEVLHAMG